MLNGRRSLLLVKTCEASLTPLPLSKPGINLGIQITSCAARVRARLVLVCLCPQLVRMMLIVLCTVLYCVLYCTVLYIQAGGWRMQLPRPRGYPWLRQKTVPLPRLASCRDPGLLSRLATSSNPVTLAFLPPSFLPMIVIFAFFSGDYDPTYASIEEFRPPHQPSFLHSHTGASLAWSPLNTTGEKIFYLKSKYF